MDGQPAVYLGRIVSKENFRVFVYAPNGDKKIVNSWEEFEKHMASGVWFDSVETARELVCVDSDRGVVESEPEAPKKRQAKPKKPLEAREEAKSLDAELPATVAENAAVQVKNDDFLSDARA